MSVVNKMLRDLESREQNLTISANYVATKSNKLWVFVALLVTLISITAISSVYIAVNTNTEASDKSEDTIPSKKEPIILKEGDQLAKRLPTEQDLQAKAVNTSAVLQNQVNEQLPLLAKSETTPSIADTQISIADTQTNSTNQSVLKIHASDGAQANLSSLRAQAHMASQNKDDEKVIALLNEILYLSPQEHRTRKQLAALYFSKKRFQEAQLTLEQGLVISPGESSLRLMLSRIFFKAGDNLRAFSILAEHPYPNMASDEFVSFRAALAEKVGDYLSAQNDYQLLVQRNPNDAKWWLGLGVSQEKQKKKDQALSSYQQAQSLNQLPAQVDSFVSQRINLLAGQF